MTQLVLSHDMRAPDFGTPPAELYQAALDQCEWADRLGFHTATFMEHHASADGYLPSPIILASAVAARTRKMLLELRVMLLPLYHPVRAAEDLAVLDIISGGRLRLTFGAGYRWEEYDQYGLDFRKRPSLMERGIQTLKSAWSGEPFEFEGKTIRILPRPVQRPHPPIQIGGSSKAAAERAARIADGYYPPRAVFYQDYVDALAREGRVAPGPGPRGAYVYLHVSNDPAKTWRQVSPHALYENNEYARWLSVKGQGDKAIYRPVTDADELRGSYKIVTPDECVEMARKDGTLVFKPLLSGLDPAIAWDNLRLFESEVLPRIGALTPPGPFLRG
jgi:alkanesulfonate monooxygenase SsuD/methylene tetrahydromethanopterin reductase-like flavin-dependent oxidoreductase (luciferase family)